MNKDLNQIIKEVNELKQIKSIDWDAILAFQYDVQEKIIELVQDLIGYPIYEWRKVGKIKKVGVFKEKMLIRAADLKEYLTGDKFYKENVGLRSDYQTYHDEILNIIILDAFDEFHDLLCAKVEFVDEENVYKEEELYLNDFSDLYRLIADNFEIDFPDIILGNHTLASIIRGN